MAENPGAPSAGVQALGTQGMPGPGSRIAGYVIEEKVGAGGMAVVYRARDDVLGRLVAVKVLSPALAADGEFRARFLRESRAVAAVDDPRIVPVYGAGEADGLLYIASRFVAGGDLNRLQRAAGGLLASAQAADLIAQVAGALDAAHTIGLVHRDVKPGNILVERIPGRPDRAYLSDFGLSKSTSSTTGLTAAGSFMGTPDYSAPEQIAGDAVDGRADQYALACVGFSLLTGAAPFTRGDALATLFAHVNAPVPALTAMRPELPVAVDAVMAKAMAKNPADRYDSCAAFAAALRGALGPAEALGPQPVSLPWEPGSSFSALGFSALGYQETVTSGWQGPPAPPGAQDAPASPDPRWQAASAAQEPPGTFPQDAGSTIALGGARPWPPGSGLGLRFLRRKPGLIAGGSVAAAVILLVGVIVGVSVSGQHGGAPGPSGRTTPSGAAKSASLVASLAAPDGSRMRDAFFSADGKYLAAGGATPDVYVWSVATHKLIAAVSVGGNDQAYPVSFSADDQTLYAIDATDEELYDFDLATRQATHAYPLPAGSVVGDTPDSSMLGVFEPGGTVAEYDMATGQRYAEVQNPGTAAVEAVRPDGDGKFILISDADGLSYLVDALSGKVTGTFRYPDTGTSTLYPSISLDGNTVYVPGGVNGAAKLWDRTAGAYVTPAGPRWPAADNGINFSADSKFVLTSPRASSDMVDTWDIATHAHVSTVTVPGSANQDLLSLSPGASELLASGPVDAGQETFAKLNLWSIPR